MADVIASGVSGILQGVGGIIDKFMVGKTQAEKDQMALEIQQLQAQEAATTGQLDINKQEAASQSIFVAGWRPAIGWICGVGLLCATLMPLLVWIASLFGFHGSPPSIDTGTLLTLLMSLLGLGAMRTTEKVNGIKAGH
jgi:hypothetical protein